MQDILTNVDEDVSGRKSKPFDISSGFDVSGMNFRYLSLSRNGWFNFLMEWQYGNSTQTDVVLPFNGSLSFLRDRSGTSNKVVQGKIFLEYVKNRVFSVKDQPYALP
jgi:hypothetical protein